MENWDDFRYFLAVAETGSVSAAARRLDTTQPTVGRRIVELERRLGSTLFVRGPSGYRLTDEGAQVRDRARTIEAESLIIQESLRYAGNHRSGRVTFTMPESLDRAVIGPLLRQFHHEYPDIQLDLMVSYQAMNLLAWQADVALRVGDPGSGESVGRCLGKAHFGLYASQAYLARRGAPATLAELTKHDIIDSVREIRNLPQCRLLRELAGNAHCSLSADSVAVQIQAAEGDLGIVALPAYAAVHHASLIRILPDGFDLTRDVWLLTHRDLKSSSRIRAVLDFFGEQVAARLGDLQPTSARIPSRRRRAQARH